MTVVGERCVEEISDAGSIPASSINKTECQWHSVFVYNEQKGGNNADVIPSSILFKFSFNSGKIMQEKTDYNIS